jgi:plastocyanin
VPALEAGSYPFNCLVHPTMVGTIEAVEGGGGGGGGGPSVTVAAQNIAFDTETIELPADTPATIVFENRDAGVQHNIAIYEDDTLATTLFEGELVTGPATVEYQIPPLPPGEYFFHCVVHPNMSGTVIVGGGGPGAIETSIPFTPSPVDTSPSAPTPSGGVATVVTAQGIAFDTAEIVLPASQAARIHFVNNDAGVQHNLVISGDESLAEQFFNGDLVMGVGEADYVIPPLEPGTYYFACVVHPNMNGVVTVA